MVVRSLSAKCSGDGFDILQIVKVWLVREREKPLKELDVGEHRLGDSRQ